MIDFRLKVFCSVAHNLSFTKASKELYVSQPAISTYKNLKQNTAPDCSREWVLT